MSTKTDLQALLVTLKTANTAADTKGEVAALPYENEQLARRQADSIAAQSARATKNTALAALDAYVEALP